MQGIAGLGHDARQRGQRLDQGFRVGIGFMGRMEERRVDLLKKRDQVGRLGELVDEWLDGLEHGFHLHQIRIRCVEQRLGTHH